MMRPTRPRLALAAMAVAAVAVALTQLAGAKTPPHPAGHSVGFAPAYVASRTITTPVAAPPATRPPATPFLPSTSPTPFLPPKRTTPFLPPKPATPPRPFLPTNRTTPFFRSTPTRPIAPTAPVATARAARGFALAVLATLPVKGRAPMTGYGRAQFGPAWTDNSTAPDGHNGCDTRDDILAAQLRRVVRSGTCKVTSGYETDPYTGTALHFVRGHSDVDIDHVVALGDAWQTGAQRLSRAERVRLANDPLNLLAVWSSANRQKGDADAASWLPKVKSYRCAYVARQIAVKHRYGLWVTAAERDAMRRVLTACPGQVAPTGGAGRYAERPTLGSSLRPTRHEPVAG